MPGTLTSEQVTAVVRRKGARWRWILVVTIVVVLAVVGLLLWFTAQSEGPTHAYELNGSLEDEHGGPALIALGDGTLNPEGYAFTPRGGLEVNVDLGESYTIEVRVRIDGGGQWVKLLDFKDRLADSGFYFWNGSQIQFYFEGSCPSEHRGNMVQGCPPLGRRWALNGTPGAISVGSFATIRVVRDGATGTVEASVDGERQTWAPEEVFRSNSAFWVSDDPLPSLADLEALGRGDVLYDYGDDAVQNSFHVLSIMADDSKSRGYESTGGEIDYIHITIP